MITHVVGALLFVGLTVAVFWYQYAQIEPGDNTSIWNGLRWEFGLLILLALPLEPIANGMRIWVVARVLQPGISLWTGIVADSANIGMAILTPSQTGGGPAQMYVLCRAGASLGTSFTISLITFFGTLVALLCIGLFSLFLGSAQMGPLFAGAVWAITLLAGSSLMAAFFPGLFRVVLATSSRLFARLTKRSDRLAPWRPPGADPAEPAADLMGPYARAVVNALYAYRQDAARFLQHGKLAFVGVAALTCVFIFMRCLMAYLGVRFFGIDVGFLEVLSIQLALIFIVYFAPTPGGAGIAEGASFFAMGAIVAPAIAPFYNLLWRFTTGYLQGIAGLYWLSRAVVRDRRRSAKVESDNPGAREKKPEKNAAQAAPLKADPSAGAHGCTAQRARGRVALKVAL